MAQEPKRAPHLHSHQEDKPPAMGREVRATKGRPEEARTDAGAVLRPNSTDEGGEPQGFRKEAATGPTGGKGEASVRIC